MLQTRQEIVKKTNNKDPFERITTNISTFFHDWAEKTGIGQGEYMDTQLKYVSKTTSKEH